MISPAFGVIMIVAVAQAVVHGELKPGEQLLDLEMLTGETRFYLLGELVPGVCYEARVSSIGSCSTGVEIQLEVGLANNILPSTGRLLLDTERRKFVVAPDGLFFAADDIRKFDTASDVILTVTARSTSPRAALNPGIAKFSLQLERFYFGLLPQSAVPTVIAALSALLLALKFAVPAIMAWY